MIPAEAAGRLSNFRRAVKWLAPPTSRPYRKLRRGCPFVCWRFWTARGWASRRKRRRRRTRTRANTTEARQRPLFHFAEERELITAGLLELVLVAPSPPAIHDHLCGCLQSCKRRRPIRSHLQKLLQSDTVLWFVLRRAWERTAAVYTARHYLVRLRKSRRARYLVPRWLLCLAAVLVVESLLLSVLGVASLRSLVALVS
jgi:hypothetical protein